MDQKYDLAQIVGLLMCLAMTSLIGWVVYKCIWSSFGENKGKTYTAREMLHFWNSEEGKEISDSMGRLGKDAESLKETLRKVRDEKKAAVKKLDASRNHMMNTTMALSMLLRAEADRANHLADLIDPFRADYVEHFESVTESEQMNSCGEFATFARVFEAAMEFHEVDKRRSDTKVAGGEG